MQGEESGKSPVPQTEALVRGLLVESYLESDLSNHPNLHRTEPVSEKQTLVTTHGLFEEKKP